MKSFGSMRPVLSFIPPSFIGPLAGLWLIAGCSVSAPGPKLRAVTPARVSAFAPTGILIRGEGIEYATYADLDRPGQSTFALDLHVRLIGPETLELLQAERLSTTEVRAQVPAALLLGKYAVEVSTARGVARLPQALEVANCFLDCERGPSDGGCFTWPDLDRDGYGKLGDGEAVCADDAGARAARGGDCQDGDPSTHPDAFELCNGIDDDCDGVADDGTCVADAGWKARTDTGGNGHDWETAASYGRGRLWLAERQRVFLRQGSGAFVEVTGCANKLTSAWANPLSGAAYFGGDGVVTPGATTGSCGSSQIVSGEVSGIQGFGARIYGATRDGTLLEGLAGALVQRPGFGAGVTVNDVQGASVSSLFAVGSAANRPKVWRISTDGGAFVDEGAQLLPVADQTLTAVWAVDDSLVYAVGSRGALLERRAGNWRVLGAADGGLSAVRAFGPARVYAATTDGRVLRFDGTRWVLLYRHPTAVVFTDIAASDEDDLWVVGHNGVVVHWNE
jgi:hypothetical protein